MLHFQESFGDLGIRNFFHTSNLISLEFKLRFKWDNFFLPMFSFNCLDFRSTLSFNFPHFLCVAQFIWDWFSLCRNIIIRKSHEKKLAWNVVQCNVQITLRSRSQCRNFMSFHAWNHPTRKSWKWKCFWASTSTKSSLMCVSFCFWYA